MVANQSTIFSLGFHSMIVGFLLVGSYLIGSIPFSWIIARFVRGVDIRYDGEGNVGARNVWHTVGHFYGGLAAVLDVSKGLSIFLLAEMFAPSPLVIWLCGFFGVLGHAFPIFLRGEGGKGASVVVGFLLGYHPLALLLAFLPTAILLLLRVSFHLSISIGFISLVVFWLPIIFHRPLIEVGAAIALMVFPGIKRILDNAHMKAVRAKSGWRWE